MTSCTVSLSYPPVLAVQGFMITAVQCERDPQFFAIITGELEAVRGLLSPMTTLPVCARFEGGIADLRSGSSAF
ncbi:hypothetical protein ETR_01491 [Erwinia tracheiphila PSU-1]|nr:hypothetical protein ETR_01491 [Erwinia tracheiphila PSU-1]